MKTCMTILFAFILTTTATFGQTTILWNESVNGELRQTTIPPRFLALSNSAPIA